MNQSDGNSARDAQEAAELPRDGILMCACCSERPVSVTLLLGDVLGIVSVCYTCAGLLLAVQALGEVDDD
jgi:hypothetical protein